MFSTLAQSSIKAMF
ncbi:hypothetical protein ACERYU_003096 [Escherichia coli]|nr:hypothetical protein [Escherichia coli]MCI7297350.1 hypothetical protein [Shigella dysenteriae]EHK6496087.1 hypothetical protein [Escherichia coli]EHN4757261.1 hypothetical protein [Escherichia coli]EHT3679918.1 hypothetical protein [Escherichia coli]EHZ4321744.1 hypothetical protein [Escherichia coli]